MNSTRRVFFGVSAATPVLLNPIQVSATQPAAQSLGQDTRSTLKAVMDLMIPAGDGMPSASQAGGLTYLESLMQSDKDAGAEVTKGLMVADAFSQRIFQQPFRQLTEDDQIAVLRDMENTALSVLDLLRAYVYEAYYTQPSIWRLIGYELYPTDHAGPHLKPFDESSLADVRKMPKLYRDA